MAGGHTLDERRPKMAIERWDPFREMVSLRDAVNSLLQESFVRPRRRAGAGGPTTLPLDVAETENEFVVKASLPGIKPEDVQITVHGDTLTIRGESKAEEEKQGQTWHLRERRSGVVPALVEPGYADRCGQGQRPVRARGPDPDAAQVGAGPAEADQDRRPVNPSRSAEARGLGVGHARSFVERRGPTGSPDTGDGVRKPVRPPCESRPRQNHGR